MSIPLAGTSPAPRRTGRSVGALVTAFLAVAILSLGTDQVFHMLGVYPPWGERMSDPLFGLATAYRVVFTIAGGYIVARLAPDRPVRHAIVLGVIGTVFATAGAVATWNTDLGPHWYAIALIATALPCSWAGAKLHQQSLIR
jgi:hypothetical protein